MNYLLKLTHPKEYTINEYNVFGHYLKTYKVIPYMDFINNHMAELTKQLTNFDTGYSFKGGSTVTVVYDDNEQEEINFTVRVKVQIKATVDLNYLSVKDHSLLKFVY